MGRVRLDLFAQRSGCFSHILRFKAGFFKLRLRTTNTHRNRLPHCTDDIWILDNIVGGYDQCDWLINSIICLCHSRCTPHHSLANTARWNGKSVAHLVELINDTHSVVNLNTKRFHSRNDRVGSTFNAIYLIAYHSIDIGNLRKLRGIFHIISETCKWCCRVYKIGICSTNLYRLVSSVGQKCFVWSVGFIRYFHQLCHSTVKLNHCVIQAGYTAHNAGDYAAQHHPWTHLCGICL